MAEQMELHVFDPDSLSRLNHLFNSCWDEVRTEIRSFLNAENESSLRQTIAARIFAEAGRGVVDPQELRRKALFGVCNKLA
jgi:hypothetical protein